MRDLLERRRLVLALLLLAALIAFIWIQRLRSPISVQQAAAVRGLTKNPIGRLIAKRRIQKAPQETSVAPWNISVPDISGIPDLRLHDFFGQNPEPQDDDDDDDSPHQAPHPIWRGGANNPYERNHYAIDDPELPVY